MVKPKICITLVKSFILSLLTSCSSMYIAPTMPNPLFEKKGEVEAEATLGFTSVNGTVCYAFTDKYALFANGSYSFKNFTPYYDFLDYAFEQDGSTYIDLTEEGTFAHQYAELGAGRYSISLKRYLKLEIFTGFGLGKATDTDYYGNYSNQYYIAFIQGNLGYNFRIASVGWSLRGGLSKFDFSWRNHDQNQYENQVQKFSNTHLQFGAFVKFNTGNLCPILRLGISVLEPINLPSATYPERAFIDNSPNYTLNNFSIGLNYSF